MDRLEAMIMLVATVDAGSLSAAARALGVPVPTLSRKVADLEARLGTQLLTRTTRKLALTDAGAAYVASVRRILEQVEEAEREAAGEFLAPRGGLVITAPVRFGRRHVLPVIAGFLAQFPDIHVRLVLGDRRFDLLDDNIDMAVRIGELPDSALIATRVGHLSVITCASPGLLKVEGAPRVPEDLTRRSCVSTELQLAQDGWRYRDPVTGQARQVAIAPRLVTTAEAVADAAMAGVGFAQLLDYQGFEALRAGVLQRVLDDFEPAPLPVHLIHVARGQMPLKMRRFIDFAAPRLRQAIAGFGGAPS